MDVLIRVRGRGCIFNPSAKEGRFISVQVMEGGRKRENMARDQLHSMRQWCLEESVTKRRQIRAPSLCRAGPAAPEGDVWWHRPLNTTFPTCAALGSHEAADLLYCHWCITEQSCEGFWVIRFPSSPQPCLNPINCLLYLSKQKTQRQRKIELWDCLSSHPPVSIQSVVHTVIKKRNNNNPRYSHEHVNIFAPVFLMLLYVLQNLYPYL